METKLVNEAALKKVLARAVTLPLLLMTFLAVLLFWQITRFLAVTAAVERSNQSVTDAHRTEKLLVDLETGFRGYLLTNEKVFLAPYNAALPQVGPSMDAIERSANGSPDAAEKMRRLRGQYLDWQRYALETMAVRAGGGDIKAIVVTQRGKKLMDAMRATIDGFIGELERSRDAKSRAAQHSARVVLGTGAGLTLVLGLLLGLFTRAQLVAVGSSYGRALARREEAERDLRALNNDLEKRVLARTAELSTANAALNDEVRERRRAEDEVGLYASRLEQSNRELQDFAVVASHDLQEPLRKIQAFGDLLEDEYGREIAGDGREYLDEMRNAAGRMQSLIQALLTLSRVSTKGQPFAPINLNDIVRDVLTDLETRVEQTKGRVDVESLPTLDADPMQMRQLFQNLIGNALKFHLKDRPPVVRVSTEVLPPDPSAAGVDGQEHARITVEDNGVGFDEKYLDRIFAPFQRLHGRSGYEGTGMGLTICRRIAERHFGTITARSAPNEGSAFIITLPTRQNTGENANA